MPLSAAAGRAIGKLFRNLKNPRWLAQQTAESVVSITVLNWAGNRVKAFYKGKIVHNGDEKIGEIYHCSDGHNYILTLNGSQYRYDADTDTWEDA
jgi:hypothetical protein